MGIIVQVYRNDLGECTNGGISATASKLTVINIEGPSEPTEDAPAVLLIDGPTVGPRNPIIVPAVIEGGEWIPERRPDACRGAGGNYAGTSDSRFSRATGQYGGVMIHDRFETREMQRMYGD